MFRVGTWLELSFRVSLGPPRRASQPLPPVSKVTAPSPCVQSRPSPCVLKAAMWALRQSRNVGILTSNCPNPKIRPLRGGKAQPLL